MNIIQKLETLNACEDALEWVKQMNGSNPEKLWNECEHGDWMLWLVGKLDIDRKRLALAACQCTRLVWNLMEDERSRKGIEVAEAWARGEATEDELEQASDAAANAAAYAANAAAYVADAAADAAYAATYATYVASASDAAANAAASAANAADAATSAAYAAAYASAAYVADAAARKDTLKECADITRQHFTFTEVYEAFESIASDLQIGMEGIKEE